MSDVSAVEKGIRLQLAEIKRKKLELLQGMKAHVAQNALRFFEPHSKQRVFFDALQDENKKVFCIQGGNRCLYSLTSVQTSDGPKHISDISPGDMVLHDSEAYVPVLEVYVNGERDLSLYTFERDIHLVCTPDHKILGWGFRDCPDKDAPRMIPVDDIRLAAEHFPGHGVVPLELVGVEPWGTGPTYDLLVDHPDHRFVLANSLVVSNSGKTTSLVAAGVSLLMGAYPWNMEKLRFEPPIKMRLCGEDMGHHVKEVLIPKLKGFLPNDFVSATRKNTQGVDAHWTFKNGSTLEILSYEQDTDIYEGWDGHVVLFDEPPPRSKYVACKRGLVDHDGICLFSFTPLKEPWIYDEIVTNPDPAYFFVQVDTLDNPHLSVSAIEEFKKSLTPEEQEARLRGGWLFLQGLVYKDFNPAVHIIDDFDRIPNDWSLYVAIDTHPRTEQALVFMAVDPKERYYIVHNIFQFGTPEEIVDWIIEFHKVVHEVDMAIIEPASQGDQNRGESTFDIIEAGLGKHGIPLELGSKDLAGGILKVKDCLRSRNGQPSLFVCRSADRVVYEFGRYVWDEWRMEGKDAKQRPKDKDDHQMENIRRLIQHPVTYRSKSFVKGLVAEANRGYSPTDSVVGY